MVIRYEDLSDIYEEGGRWHCDESLYPENRGFNQHSFDTKQQARDFVNKIKAQDNQRDLFNTPDERPVLMSEVKRNLFDKAKQKGAKCPCCGQFTKIYRRTINSMMARQLCHAADTFQPGVEFHVGELPQCASGVGDWAKLEYWGLIRAVATEDEGDTVRKSGIWTVTEKGYLFAQKKAYVPKYAIVYNGRLLELEGNHIDITDALGKKFSYAEIMKPVGNVLTGAA